ncbi:rho GTPase-activating protein REN1 [Dendrobium catenatum]|uniref:rho GTPase-activating protein REN1 n=1 Tax=Dendrobium catenatum TaxID=906689 RepID=UPI0009F5571D|nr:rho GTPase-activating protein REN1 [Dendrobium catenatum]
MASFQMNENSIQSTACRCGEGDQNIWTTRTSENSDNQSSSCRNCEILKSGPLLISSKGIGWTSWKKRWFVLSRKSLMFYRVDPNALPQKGSEAPNPTLGGIELNNSGSVVVKTDKKLLTVLFPDGRDGRAFTLKTETLEELNEWKAVLEGALAQAPSANQVMGPSGIFLNEVADSIEASVDLCKDKPPTTSSIIGRPVLLALQEIDGSPSFLEKALRFIEEHGIKVEGILRQSADVEEVMHRVQEYEQGKTEFGPDEDAHVIGDCIKHVLREMPSSPVPVSCCMTLVDAYRTYRGSRVKNMRDAIYGTFPEPNRRLLQRTLQMILTVAAHKAENRMSLSALAACMAPLLLRPLLAGECELSNSFQMDSDESFQLLQAAAAANHAQAIVLILLEEYKNIFDDNSFSSELYTESEDDDIEDDESTDNDISQVDGYRDAENDKKPDAEGNMDHSYSETSSGSDNDVGSEDDSDLGSDVDSEVGGNVGSHIGNDVGSNVRSDAHCDVDSNGVSVVRSDAGSDMGSNLSRDQDIKDISAHSIAARNLEVVENTAISSKKVSAFLHDDIYLKTSASAHDQSSAYIPSFGNADIQHDDDLPIENTNSTIPLYQESHEPTVGFLSTIVTNNLVNLKPSAPSIIKFAEQSKEAKPAMRNKLGRTSARKNLSVDSIEDISDDESAIQRLENAQIDLLTKISEEIKGNAVLQASLDRRKEDLPERRLALEKEVVRLKAILQKERDLRSHLESGLMNLQSDNLTTLACLDRKIIADLEEIALSVSDINNLKHNITDLTEQLHHGCTTLCQSCGQPIYRRDERQEKADDIPNEHKKDNPLKHDNTKDEAKSSTSLKERQTYQKLLPRVSNQSVARYSEASLSEDRNRASKKLARWEGTKKDALESPTRRMSSQKQKPSISSVNSETYEETNNTVFSEEQITLLRNNATRRQAHKIEEGFSSASTLTKLTNRLNFLKERRVQLANELQNLDSGRAAGFEAPLKTNNN